MGKSMYKGDDGLPGVFLELLKLIFMNFNETKLLQRCVKDAQNDNKCINYYGHGVLSTNVA